jgi:hypothetical protein
MLGMQRAPRFGLVLPSLLVVACGAEPAPGPSSAPGGSPPRIAGSGGSAGAGSPPTAGSPVGGSAGGPSAGSSGSAGTQSSEGGSNSSGGAGGNAGSGGTPAQPDSCENSAFTCVPVPGAGPYGTRSFAVPARQNWVNTGLYLRTGQSATLTETGTWQVQGSGGGIDHGPCKLGDLVARVGLHYKDSELTCVKGSATLSADKDGILFVSALTSNDLGETYESRHDASGEKQVSVTSSADTVPTVQGADSAGFGFTEIASGWVEVWGAHVILTLPADSAEKDRQVLGRATERLDAIYELEAELRGAVPHHGQRIRFFPDGTQPGYMLAGNPVRMELTLVDGGDRTRISRAGEAGTDVWGFAHELGHDFSFAPQGFWTYQENTLESWCNLFSIYSLEKLGLELHDSTVNCTAQSTGSYASWDAWGGLCFLRQFQFRYGWDFYAEYFEQIKDTTSTGGDAWQFVHDKFEAIAGEDVTPLFTAWQVPN